MKAFADINKMKDAVSVLRASKEAFVNENYIFSDSEKELLYSIDLILEYFDFVFKFYDKKVGK